MAGHAGDLLEKRVSAYYMLHVNLNATILLQRDSAGFPSTESISA